MYSTMKSRKNQKSDQKWFTPMFESFELNTPKKICLDSSVAAKTYPQTNKSSKINDSTSHLNPNNALTENWIDKFSPKSITELAVNNKKVQEIEDWITKSLNSNRILLLTGPSGCGKTAAVQMLAQHTGIRVSEWVTPMDIEHTKEYGNESFTYQEKQSDLFIEFLLKASRYPSLLNSNSSRIILVEDFPNVFLKTPTEFTNVLQKYNERGKCPLIFVCSETFSGSTNIIWNLFPPGVQDEFKITQISLNPVSTTNMKAALKRITTIMSKDFSSFYELPNQETIDGIINSSMGDIRSAINNLHFASLKSEFSSLNNSISLKKQVKTKKKKSSVKPKLNAMGKDENINIMHGVGRVLNPKLREKTLENPHEEYVHSPNSIAEQFQTQPVAFVGYIHENYLPHFSDIKHVEMAAQYLSDADCLLNEWKEKDGKFFGLSVAIAGVMTTNKSPVSSWHPIRGSKYPRIIYPCITEMPLLDSNQLIQGKVLAADFKTYYDVIKTVNINPPDDDEIEDIFIE